MSIASPFSLKHLKIFTATWNHSSRLSKNQTLYLYRCFSLIKRDPPPPLKSLKRVLGQRIAPIPGENSGYDVRTAQQQIEGYFSHEEHLARRRHLMEELFVKPYFREWNMLRDHEGKLFLAPTKLFRADKALYFPNMCGYTPANTRGFYNSTTMLKGRVSIVTYTSGTLAWFHTESFVQKNQQLQELLQLLKREEEQLGLPGAQKVQINVEEKFMRRTILWWSMGNLRKMLGGREQWERHIVVNKGITPEIKECLGIQNGGIGYVYLVDPECRIRWAGCGYAQPWELEALVNGLKKLVNMNRRAHEEIATKEQEQATEVKPEDQELTEENVTEATLTTDTARGVAGA